MMSEKLKTIKEQKRIEEQKKGYLQKMFPKNGAKVPELRFAGFAGDWEERKAKEMIKTHHFRSYLAEPNDVGNYEVIQMDIHGELLNV